MEPTSPGTQFPAGKHDTRRKYTEIFAEPPTKKPFSSTTTAFRHTRPSSLHLSAAHDHSQDRRAIPDPPLSRKDKLHPRRNDSRWQTAQIFQPQYFEYKNNRIDEKIKEGRDQIAAFPESSGQFPELSSEISHPEHIPQ